MRVMVFFLLGTNQQVITLQNLALANRLPLELSMSGMVCWESLQGAGWACFPMLCFGREKKH